MDIRNIHTILENTGLPVTYYQWPENEAPSAPYLVWYFPNSINFDADNAVYQRIEEMNVELYTATKDFVLEQTVEDELTSAGFVWEKTETYIKSERMYQVLYQTSVIVDDITA